MSRSAALYGVSPGAGTPAAHKETHQLGGGDAFTTSNWLNCLFQGAYDQSTTTLMPLGQVPDAYQLFRRRNLDTDVRTLEGAGALRALNVQAGGAGASLTYSMPANTITTGDILFVIGMWEVGAAAAVSLSLDSQNCVASGTSAAATGISIGWFQVITPTTQLRGGIQIDSTSGDGIDGNVGAGTVTLNSGTKDVACTAAGNTVRALLVYRLPKPVPVTPSNTSLAAEYDFNDLASLLKGSYYTAGAGRLDRTGIPSFAAPFSVIVWARTDGAGDAHFFNVSDGSATNRYALVFSNSANTFQWVNRSGTGGAVELNLDIGAGGTYTAGQWYCFILGHDGTNLYAYSSGAPAGASGAATVPAALDRIRLFLDESGGNAASGAMAYLMVSSGNLGGAGNASTRTSIFNGEDPYTIVGAANVLARWKLDNAITSDVGSYDFTSTGTLAALNSLIVARDLSGNAKHLSRQLVVGGGNPGSSPVWGATSANGQGGITFAPANNTNLSTISVPLTAVGFSWFAVASSSDTATNQAIATIGDSGTPTNYWALMAGGAETSDPCREEARDAGTAATGANSGTFFASGVLGLFAGRETDVASRGARFNGGTEGTNTDSRTLTTTPNGLVVGMDVAAAQEFTGVLGWLRIYSAVSDATRLEVQAYVRARWGIAAIPP